MAQNIVKEQTIEYLLAQTPAALLREVFELATDLEGTGWPRQQHLDVGLWSALVEAVGREGSLTD
jgi:hypothetical protein